MDVRTSNAAIDISQEEDFRIRMPNGVYISTQPICNEKLEGMTSIVGYQHRRASERGRESKGGPEARDSLDEV